MLTKIIFVVLCLLSIPALLVIGAFMQNDLPWGDPPGVATRLQHYLTTNVAETIAETPYPELLIREYDYPKEAFFSLLEKAVAKLGWAIEEQPDQAYTLFVVVKTPLWGYKDDVLIRLLPASDNSYHLYIRSSSRKGHGDLGTNTRHILDLYNQIEQQMLTPTDTDK